MSLGALLGDDAELTGYMRALAHGEQDGGERIGEWARGSHEDPDAAGGGRVVAWGE